MRNTLALAAASACLSSAFAHEATAFVPRHVTADSIDRTHLFRRQARTYPPALQRNPPPQQAWIDAYNTARAGGLIPSAPVATMAGAYPAGTNTGPTGICSWTASQCTGPDTVFSPDGTIGIAFDDGPGPSATGLYAFLEQSNQTATHFMIGSTILGNPAGFDEAVRMGGQIAVHTWTHPQMTTQTDIAILGELGWTAQIIYDMSGLLPSIWRPPYGDIDNRVRAIATHVFGLHAVIWNHDSFDWCLSTAGTSNCGPQLGGPANEAALVNSLNSWINGPKSPGLLILEHELTSASANAFMTVYPSMRSRGWRPLGISEALGIDWYQNQPRPGLPTQNMTVGRLASYTMTAGAPSSSSATAPPSSSARAASSASSARSGPSTTPAGSTSLDQTGTQTRASPMSLGALVGAAIGGAAFLFSLLALLCCARRRGWCCFARRVRHTYDYDAALTARRDDLRDNGGPREKTGFYASDTLLLANGESTYTLEPMQYSPRPSNSRLSSYAREGTYDAEISALTLPRSTPGLPPGAAYGRRAERQGLLAI